MENGTPAPQGNTQTPGAGAAPPAAGAAASDSILAGPPPQPTNAGKDATPSGQASNGTTGATQGQTGAGGTAQGGTGGTTAPADLELKFPEGFKADSKLVESFKGLAKEAGLKGETAQKLADLYVQSQGAYAESLKAGWEQQRRTWTEAAKGDKEFGGQAFQESVLRAQQALQKFGTPELKNYLVNIGADNHPEMLRLLVRVGKAIAEDKVAGAGAGPGGAAPDSEEARLRAMFPTHFKDK